MDCVFRLRDQLELIWEAVENLSKVEGSHAQFIGAMFSVALNHCDAIQLLIEKRNYPSADALARPMLETTIRSIWLHRIANEPQINRCISKDKFKDTWKLIDEIENGHNLPPMLSRFWSHLRPVMHSFTHGGKENACRQISDDGHITPSKPETEIRELIFITGAVSLTIAAELSDLTHTTSNRVELENLLSNSQQWFSLHS